LEVLEGGRASPHLHSNILDTLGYITLTRGDLAGARTHWETLLTIALELHDYGKVHLGLHGLGNVAAAQSRALRAMRLFGAAEKARELGGRVVTPSADAAHFAPWRKLARESLDAEAADQAWREGLSMTIDMAVAYARANSD